MARLKNGILDNHITGSIQNVVFSSRNGKPYMRSKPAQYRDKKSPAQLASRMKLSQLSKLLKTFKPALDIGFKHTPLGKSSRDVAFRANSQKVIQGNYPDMYICLPELKVSAGTLNAPLNCKAHKNDNSNSIVISWDAERPKRGNGADSDRLLLLMYSEYSNSLLVESFIGRRKDGQLIFEIDPGFLDKSSKNKTYNIPFSSGSISDDEETGKQSQVNGLHVWLSFISVDGQQISDSSYVVVEN
ncbi:MAG: DUF6266 family protein [Balneolales bacterium]|nr:DUF6266 family protein [Balneolales bacterium]